MARMSDFEQRGFQDEANIRATLSEEELMQKVTRPSSPPGGFFSASNPARDRDESEINPTRRGSVEREKRTPFRHTRRIADVFLVEFQELFLGSGTHLCKTG
jgi:hypothetical protein